MRRVVGEMKDGLNKGVDVGNSLTSIEVQGMVEVTLHSQREDRLQMVLSECLLDEMDKRERLRVS